MTRHDKVCITYGLFLVVVVCFELSTCRGQAQSNDRTVLTLARCMVAESWFDAERDHRAIAGVLIRKAARSGRSLLWITRAYCRGLHRRNAPWLRQLTASPVKPGGWPSRWRWSSVRDDWLDVLQCAKDAVDGILVDPCNGLASHWRGPHDETPSWFEPVACGITENIFGRVKTKKGIGK